MSILTLLKGIFLANAVLAVAAIFLIIKIVKDFRE